MRCLSLSFCLLQTVVKDITKRKFLSLPLWRDHRLTNKHFRRRLHTPRCHCNLPPLHNSTPFCCLSWRVRKGGGVERERERERRRGRNKNYQSVLALAACFVRARPVHTHPSSSSSSSPLQGCFGLKYTCNSKSSQNRVEGRRG